MKSKDQFEYEKGQEIMMSIADLSEIKLDDSNIVSANDSLA